MNIEELLSGDETFRHMLLRHMQQDCEYYLGWGQRNTSRLWAGNEKDHIEIMRMLYDSFDACQKPQYITSADIDSYEARILNDIMPQ